MAGVVYSDVFSFGPGLKGSVNFGTITQQTPNFQQFAVIDGVLGLACTQDFGQPTPIESMVQGGLIQDQFSFCFDKSGQGGLLTFVSSTDSTVAIQYNTYVPIWIGWRRSQPLHRLIPVHASHARHSGRVSAPLTHYLQLDINIRSNRYYVSMNDLLVAGKSIGVDPIVYSGQYGGSIVDSGTNVFLLPHEGNYSAFYSLLSSDPPITNFKTNCLLL